MDYVKMKDKLKDKVLIDLIKKGSLNFLFYSLNMIIVYTLAIFLTKYYGTAAYGRYSIIKSLILVLLNLLARELSTDFSSAIFSKILLFDELVTEVWAVKV